MLLQLNEATCVISGACEENVFTDESELPVVLREKSCESPRISVCWS